MTAEALISGFPIACLFAGLLAVGAIAGLLAVGALLALLAREFQMARLFALTLGAFLALLACCRIAELEKAGSQPATAPSVKGMAPDVGHSGEADGARQDG